jgi:hypothetical protein
VSRTILVASIAFSGLASGTGCADYAGMARARAVSDLGCSTDQIAVTEQGGSRYRASGCGRAATYACFTEGSSNPFVTQQSPMMAMMTQDEICVREGETPPPTMACPPGTGLTPQGCVPVVVSTECPAGMSFVAGRGCVPQVAPTPAAASQPPP